METKGLPEGVKLIDFQVPGPTDFELIRDEVGFHIYQGTRLGGPAAAARIEPAPGYIFVAIGNEMIFDMREYVSKKARVEFTAVKKLEPQTITVTAKFAIENALQLQGVEDALKMLQTAPGFTGLERT